MLQAGQENIRHPMKYFSSFYGLLFPLSVYILWQAASVSGRSRYEGFSFGKKRCKGIE